MDDTGAIIEKQEMLHKAQEDSKKDEENEITKALTFYIGDQIYGIEIPYLIEIIGVPHITIVPGVPNYIKGIINVRSKVLPVINVRSRFGKEEVEFNERTCTIIVAVGEVSVALIVDEVLDVLSVTAARKSEMPNLNNVNVNRFIDYILEMPDGVKLILDIRKLIYDDGMMMNQTINLD